MNHIFISYKRGEDDDFAEILAHRLRDVGFSPWRDVDKLRAGEVWRVEIDQAIRDALAMIVIMTPAAKASEYVTYEWAFALGVGVKVIPIMLKLTELHPRLEDIHYLNFTGLRLWQNLIDAVQKIADDKGYNNFIPQNTPIYIKKAIDALDNPNPSDREGAIAILVKDRNHPVVQKALLMALEHDLRDVRIQTALSIARFPNIPLQALRGLLEALHVKQYNTKATEALGKMGKVAISELLNILYDNDVQARCGAIKALGLIGDITTVPNLIQLLRNTAESDDIRDSVIFALGKIRNEVAILELFDVLHIENGTLRDTETELSQQDKNSFAYTDESDYYDKIVFPEHLVDTIRDRIEMIVEILAKEDKKHILLSNLHKESCETCASLSESLK